MRQERRGHHKAVLGDAQLFVLLPVYLFAVLLLLHHHHQPKL